MQLSKKAKSISSLKIAELTGKQHYHVKRDIEKMFQDLELDISKFGLIYLDSSNRKQTCYELEERELMILASGYSIKLRASIIDELARVKAYLDNPLKNTIEHAKRYELNKHNIPKGYFCMLRELVTEVILPLELDKKDLMEGSVPDISLGLGFCSFLRKHGIETKNLKMYKHTFQDGRIVDAKLYPYSCYHLFKEFIDIWIEGKGKQYFTDRTISLLQLKK